MAENNSGMDKAKARLRDALTRLENIVENKIDAVKAEAQNSGDSEAADLATLAELKGAQEKIIEIEETLQKALGEKESLEREVISFRKKNEDLQRVQSQVLERVDKVIDKVQVLQGDSSHSEQKRLAL